MAKKTEAVPNQKDLENENLRIYEQARSVPKYALKEIKAGRLKGMSDINPMYRIKRMTEMFGPCGIGWKYEITKQWTEIYDKEIKAFTNINLFIKWDGEWSEAIPGTGGSAFVAQERGGAYVNDEAFKMSLTDAISVATKALGVAADIYYSADGKVLNPGDSKYAPLTIDTKKDDETYERLMAKFPEVFKAQNVEELLALFNANPSLASDADFMLALSAKKKKLQQNRK